MDVTPASSTYTNPFTSFLTETDSLGVLTGMPTVATSQPNSLDLPPPALTTSFTAADSNTPMIIYSFVTETLIDLSPAQSSLYYSELNSYLTGSEYAALGSQLREELPGSVFDVETTGGFAALSSEYGASLTDQPWYSYIIDVHTQVLSEINTLLQAVATQSIVTPSSTAPQTSPTTLAKSSSSAPSATSKASSMPSASHSNTTAIALGVALGLFALLVFGGLVAAYLLRRRHRRRAILENSAAYDAPNGIDMVPEKTRSDGALTKSEPQSGEKGIGPRSELDGHIISGELQGEGDPVYELSDGRASWGMRR